MWHHDSADKSANFLVNKRMDLSAIYSKTPKGLRARASLIGGLSSHLMKVLTHVDGNSRAEIILLKFDKLTPQQLSADLAKLEQEGYIRLATVTSDTDDSWALTINFEPMQVEEYQSEAELEAVAQAKKAEQAQQLAQQQAKLEEENRLAAAEKTEKKAQKLREKEKIRAEAKVKAQLETEREEQEAAKAAETARIKAQAKIELEAKLKAQQAAEQLEQQQAVERAAKLAEETRLKAELKAREAAEQAEAAAEAKAKEHARREIERISRESEEAQKKQALEAKAQQEAERMEAQRLAEIEAAEKAHQEKLRQQQLAAEALEKQLLEAERLAQEAALKEQQAQEKIAQEKLRNEALEKEKLAKEQAHLEIANVLRKAEEDRKNAAAQLKAEKLEAKRQIKAEQEERLLAERKRKEHAKELVKQQKLKAQAEEKAKAVEVARREQEKIAKQAKTIQLEITPAEATQIDAVEVLKQELAALAYKAETEQKGSQTAKVVQAKFLAEEQANLAAKENARLEMERIGREAELARQKTSTEAHLDENKSQNKNQSKKRLPDKGLPILDDFSAAEAAEEAAFEEEELAAEAEQRIQRTIEKTAEKTAKKAAEDVGRTDIRNAALAEAEALASVHGKRPSLVSVKKIKRWLGSVSKISFIYVPVLALVLLALLHFINLSTLIKPIEQLAAESVGEPVEIKKVYASLWPQPHLALENVKIGASSIKAIHVLPAATSLFEETKVVKSLVIEGLNIEHANFGKPLNWASNISKAKNLKVEQINLKNLTLAIRDLQLESFDGKVTLTDTGALSAVDLVSSNNALSVTILPRGDNYEIALKAANWMLPFNQKIMFSTLNAKGLANQNKISFSQIEGEVYGGSVTGQAKVEWPDGTGTATGQWLSSGDFALTNASVEQLLSTFGSAVVIDGKLTLNASFSSKAREASKLASVAVMSANFDVRQGSIKGVELARAVMSRGSQSLAGNSTDFDKLSGSFKINQNQYQFGKLVLVSPQFNANGFVNINNYQTLTGRVNADLAAQSRRLQANFTITGRGKDLKSN